MGADRCHTAGRGVQKLHSGACVERGLEEVSRLGMRRP